MGVQACRLPGLKRSKPLQTLQTPKTPKRPLQWLLIGFQRPHPWLFMGVQACRLPGLKRSKPSKPLKPLKGHFHGFLWASSAGKSPHPWLFMGVQACRLPGLEPSKPVKSHFNGLNPFQPQIQPLFMGVQDLGLPAQAKRPHPWHFLWASKLAVCRRP